MNTPRPSPAAPRETREILVTSALPYANGPLHVGHMLEYIQSDIWVRFQRLRGNRICFVCADDAHGAPIMLRARQEGIRPEELIARMQTEHCADLNDFHISFDNYHSTHSDENRVLSEGIFNALNHNGHIVRRDVEQFYDPREKMFLPDRFIRGECPRCGASDQYGDNCESCGSAYTPDELKNPVAAISGATPVRKTSEHYFFKLRDFEAMLREWTGGEPLQDAARNKASEWFEDGLRDWDISRDAPYFGFTIPGESHKYFYVWLDAPIGYMASFKNLCDKTGSLDFDHYWNPSSDTELYHFIGKDILYFHALFWPAVLHGSGYRKPTALFAHGFLTINGQKMSKSRGTSLMARTYLEHFDPDYLRYYFAAKLNNKVEDIDLNLDDFSRRVNADLVGKTANIASRCAGFVHKFFGGSLGPALDDEALFAEFTAAADAVADCYERRRYSQAMRLIMELADRGNRYLNQQRPWELSGDEASHPKLLAVSTQALNLFRVLSGFLAPVAPQLSTRVEAFLGVSLTAPGDWQALQKPLLNHPIQPFQALITRLDPKRVQQMIEASAEPETAAGPLVEDPIGDIITIDDFARVDLRIARITKAEYVEGADKLLCLRLDLGGATRQVFAGIKSAYTPEQLEGRLTVMVANLAPRKMKFGVSEGMVLAAGPGGADIWLLAPDAGAAPGSRVR